MNRVAVIGKGTAGCMSAAYFAYNTDCEVDWYFDPNIKPQSVGEGSNLALPTKLNDIFGFGARDFPRIDATVKTGIYKENWGKGTKPFLHDFPSPATAIHFSAPKLQDYVADRLKDFVNIKPMNVLAKDVEADFVMDCSGKPVEFGSHKESDYIPVNSVYVTQCYWDYPRFNHTLTIARPYGWVFGIPLGNRCSIGYMYNKDISSLEEVMLDVQNIFDEYKLVPSDDTNNFSFKNYKRKSNFDDRIAYNGNASFFLEPLEATSFSTVDVVNFITFQHWFTKKDLNLASELYDAYLQAQESIIMLHYYAGSDFKTPFWEYAEERGRKCMEQVDDSFKYMLKHSVTPTGLGSYEDYFIPAQRQTMDMEALYSSWWEGSFAQNVRGLGLDLNALGC
jgi:hypothetical protein